MRVIMLFRLGRARKPGAGKETRRRGREIEVPHVVDDASLFVVVARGTQSPGGAGM
jgi:hypothetical protein